MVLPDGDMKSNSKKKKHWRKRDRTTTILIRMRGAVARCIIGFPTEALARLLVRWLVLLAGAMLGEVMRKLGGSNGSK